MPLTKEEEKELDIRQRINFCITKELMKETAYKVREQMGKDSSSLKVDDVYPCLGINRTSYSKILNASKERAKNPTFIKELDVRPAKLGTFIIEVLKGTDRRKLTEEIGIEDEEWNTYFEIYDKDKRTKNSKLQDKCKGFVDSYFSGRYKNDDKHEYTYAIIEWVKVALEYSDDEAESKINKIMNQLKDADIDLLTNVSIETLKGLRGLLTNKRADVDAVIRIKEHIEKKK